MPPRQSGTANSTGRSALLAGGSGLIGSALLEQMPRLTRAADPAGSPRQLAVYRSIDGLQRKPGAAENGPSMVRWHTVDFENLPTLPPVDDVYIALGTTIKQAGSQAAFKKIDLDLVVAIAQAARQQGAIRLAVVSALGADAASAVFYNRVKGQMEAAIVALGFETVVVAQPSLLLGDRGRLGQTKRPAEQLGIRLLGPLRGLIPASIRPIEAGVVAAALLHAMTDGRKGVSILPSRELQKIGG